jgi:sugar lactone lactonase YvrE
MFRPTAVEPPRAGRAEVRLAADRSRFRRKLLLFVLLLLIFLGLAPVVVFRLLPGVNPQRSLEPILPLFSISDLNGPLSVSIGPDDRLLVSDTGSGRLMVFDADGRRLGRIGASGGRKFAGLFGTRVDDAGRVYAADSAGGKISVFSPKGKLERRFPDHPQDSASFGPRGLTPFGIDIFENQLYVASNDGVYLFSTEGELERKLGIEGQPIGQLNYPTALAVDAADGSVYVSDQLNRRVVAFSAQGAVKWVLGRPGAKSGFFGLPRGIAVDNNRRIYVSDTFGHKVVVLSPEGELISVISIERGADDGQVSFPEGLIFDSDNRMVLVDRGNNRVQVFKIQELPKPSKGTLKQYRRFFSNVVG